MFLLFPFSVIPVAFGKMKKQDDDVLKLVKAKSVMLQ